MSTAEQACNWPQCLAPRRKDGKCFAWCKCRCHSREARLATPAAQPEMGLSEEEREAIARELGGHELDGTELGPCRTCHTQALVERIKVAAFEAGRAARAAEQAVRCHVRGCVEHVDGMHVDSVGDAVVHVGCPQCAGGNYIPVLRAESGTGEGACPVGCAYPKPCECRDRLAAVATHTRTSTHGHGPDYCGECSEAVSDWVQWPCPGATR